MRLALMAVGSKSTEETLTVAYLGGVEISETGTNGCW